MPVVFLDLSTEQAKLLNLALNRISGDWDRELLARILADLQAVPDVDLCLSGFEEDESENLLHSLDVREKRGRPETFDLDAALEAARTDPGVKRGDIWRLGEHRLLSGDATDSADVARLMGNTQTALAFTDPPYNVGCGDHGGAQPTVFGSERLCPW